MTLNLSQTLKRTRLFGVSMLLMAVQLLPLSAFLGGTAHADSTDFHVPTSTQSPNNWDTNTVANIQEVDTSYIDDNDGSTQGYDDFGFPAIPAGSTINGIEVNVVARSTDSSGCRLGVRLSWDKDDNSDRTDSKYVNLTDEFASSFLGGPNDNWGRSNWQISNFTNDNFAVFIQDNDPGNNCRDNARTYVDFLRIKIHYTPPVQPVTNPTLAQSCGLDIALVLDVSTSINDTELGQMRSAMQSFVTAFTGTPTEFSITKFATTGEVVLGFTDNLTQVSTTLGTVDGSGHTNWEDGLLKALSTFSGDRPSVPNMVIFASDGNPNTIGDGPADNASPDGSLTAMNPAITVANSLKTTEGAHILSLGIGNDLSTSNLEKISGPGAVISSDFGALATTLADLAKQLCGGTISVTKLVDDDNNPQTDPVNGGADWSFTVGNTTKQTNAQGQVVPFDLDAGTYSVTEAERAGYAVVSGVCEGAENNGQFNQANRSVTGIVVDNNDIVTCTFVNRPTTAKLTVTKVVVGGPSENSPEDFSFKVNDGASTAFENDGSNEVTVNEGAYNVTETNVPDGYTPAYSGDCSGTISGAQAKTCTITNTYTPAPTLTLRKVVINNNGGKQNADAWTLKAGDLISEKGTLNGNEAVTNPHQATAGVSYELSEEGPTGYASSGWDCDGGNRVDNVVTLEQGENVTCTITNNDNPPSDGSEKCLPRQQLPEYLDFTSKEQDGNGSISGCKFEDSNGNHNWDEDENTKSGFTIKLYTCSNDTSSVEGGTLADCEGATLHDSDVTDENGRYEFNNLADGTYMVCEVNKDQWVQTYPVDQNKQAVCWLVSIKDEDCVVHFGNQFKGQVKPSVTPPVIVPPVLAETGSPMIQGVLVGLSILGAASGITALSRRKSYAATSVN